MMQMQNNERESNAAAAERGGRASILDLSERVTRAARDSRMRNTNISSSVSLKAVAELNLRNMSLHGREGDMRLLRNKLREFRAGAGKGANGGEARAEKRPELLLVSGVSGTGKSALVMRGLREPAEKMGMAFAGGKFDLNKSAPQPLSAFVDAMSSLTEFIVERDDARKIRGDIRDAFGDEGDAMLLACSCALPGCEDLFFSEHSSSSRPQMIRKTASVRDVLGGSGGPRRRELRAKIRRRVSAESIGGREAVARLHYAIRRLLRAICSNLRGVVLFLDDLQWSDAATIDLIKSVALDDEIPSLLLVGAYRAEEVSDSHPLMLHIGDKKQMGIDTTTIELGNLSPDNVRSLVAEALRMEDNEGAVDTLAATIHKKTGGNAFFVLTFLRSLYDEHLLQYNFGAMRWLWDDDAVNSKLVTENVATILVKKLKSFEDFSQIVLKVASCLGASFSIHTTSIVVGAISSDSNHTETTLDDDAESVVSRRVSELLDEFEEVGLCERDASSAKQCRFSHDQIQSAAFELVPSDERDTFRSNIGRILMQRLDPDTLEEHLFEIVSLQNSGKAQVSGKDRLELARLNLRAGLKASENATFDTAAVYYKTGHELLGANGWQSDHNTMLQICSGGAKACYINGDLTSMDTLINEVLCREELTVEEKFNVYEVKIQAASGSSGNEAIKTAIEVRRQLGLPTPPLKPASTLTIIKEFIKTNRMVGSRSAEDIANLPELKDERIILGQRILEKLLSLINGTQPTMYPLISFLLVKTSVKHGLNASSCDAFASFGLLQCAFGQLQRGKEMAKAVELMLAKPDMRRMQSRAVVHNEACIYHWTSPLQGTLGSLLTGYQSGLEVGDVETPCWCLLYRCCHMWFVGRQLEGVLHEIETSLGVMMQLNQKHIRIILFPYLLAVKKLQGISSADDEFHSLEDLLRVASESGIVTLFGYTTLLKLELFVIFQEWEEALILLAGASDVPAALRGVFHSVRFAWLEGLIYLKAAQSSSALVAKMKYSRKASKSMKMIRGWLKKGNMNVVHAMHILSAEYHVLKGNDAKAEEQFKLAITAASRNGFLQDRALAHELAGAYYASKGDDYWVNYHLDCAERSYSDWGASAKVEELARRKEALFEENRK